MPSKKTSSDKTKECNLSQSITKSMPSNVEAELGLGSLFSGNITHLSFDCPIKLREAFKSETKDNGTSVCKELQKYMVSYVATSRIKKHALGNTLSKLVDVPFTIENLNFEQYVQSRPRRLLRKNGERKPAELNSCSISIVTSLNRSRMSLSFSYPNWVMRSS